MRDITQMWSNRADVREDFLEEETHGTQVQRVEMRWRGQNVLEKEGESVTSSVG